MDRKLEELQIIRDNKRKEFDIADKNLDNFKIKLINDELNSNYEYNELDLFSMNKKCYSSPLDICVYLDDSVEQCCLFCGENE